MSLYKPEKIRDGFEVFKVGNARATVNVARVEESTHPEHLGEKMVTIELEIIDHPEFSGRRLWTRYPLNNATKMKKLADTLFTLGIEFDLDIEGDEVKNVPEEQLYECLVQMSSLIVIVKAWTWTPKGESEPRQSHIIKGIATEGQEETGNNPAF